MHPPSCAHPTWQVNLSAPITRDLADTLRLIDALDARLAALMADAKSDASSSSSADGSAKAGIDADAPLAVCRSDGGADDSSDSSAGRGSRAPRSTGGEAGPPSVAVAAAGSLRRHRQPSASASDFAPASFATSSLGSSWRLSVSIPLDDVGGGEYSGGGGGFNGRRGGLEMPLLDARASADDDAYVRLAEEQDGSGDENAGGAAEPLDSVAYSTNGDGDESEDEDGDDTSLYQPPSLGEIEREQRSGAADATDDADLSDDESGGGFSNLFVAGGVVPRLLYQHDGRHLRSVSTASQGQSQDAAASASSPMNLASELIRRLSSWSGIGGDTSSTSSSFSFSSDSNGQPLTQVLYYRKRQSSATAITTFASAFYSEGRSSAMFCIAYYQT
jgi:hypothetical protein